MLNLSFRKEQESSQLCFLQSLSYSDRLPQWSYGMHHHGEEAELTFVAQGEGEVAFSSYTNLSTQANDIILVPPGVFHRYLCEPDQTLRYYSLHLLPGDSGHPFLNDFLCKMTAPAVIRASSPDICTPLLDLILSSLKENGNSLDFQCQAALLGLLSVTQYRAEHFPVEYAEPKETQSGMILEYINGHYSEHITRDSLSRQFNLSASYLSSIFQREHGMAPISYLIECRITNAVRNLLLTNHSITEISKTVGYDNCSHFSKLFEDRLGCLPLSFRKSEGINPNASE